MSGKMNRILISCFVALLLSVIARAQEETIVVDSINKSYKTVIAGDYDRSRLFEFFLGAHYRDEWVTPVRVRNLYLDTAHGGLKPYEAGGGRQSKSLKLRDKNGREWVLRSLDKSFGRALPEIMQGTFVEDLIDDQVTIAHPYSAFTIPPMAEAAKIYHTNPIMRYVPEQKALDSFNKEFGNRIYLLEQRPDEDWSIASNFGNAKKIVGTDKVLEKLLDDNENRIDQELYLRSRIFDIFISDWGRHDDQWRWGAFEKNDVTTYKPVPRDRDQAYTKFDGLITQMTLSVANLDRLQTFDDHVKDIKTFNYPARHLDRRLTNELSKQQWLTIAKDVQQAMTDELIESSIKKMPPEVFPISGPDIIRKLKARRKLLVTLVGDYYDFLARHVNVVGSKESEYFEVKRLNDEETLINVYDMGKNSRDHDKKPFYSRTFKTSETKDVRLYGIGGNDVFKLDGTTSEGIKVRVVGGPEADSIIDNSVVTTGSKKTGIYDDKDTYIDAGPETRRHLSNDSAIHAYDHLDFHYHKKGPKFSIFYDNPDRLFVSAGYAFKRHVWRKSPYGFEQSVNVHYSLMQNAFSMQYDGKFYTVLRKWDGRVSLNQDFVRWTNFYGLGNETERVDLDNRDYYRMRTNEFLGTATFTRRIRKHHSIDVQGSFSALKVLEDTARFISDYYAPEQLNFYERFLYASTRLGYNFQRVDNPVIPESGVMFYIGGAYSQNLKFSNRNFVTGNSILQVFVPLFWKFSLSLRGGATHIWGQPEFYQYASIGGSQTIRGFRRDRFRGQSAFYNTNELRWITDFKSYIMNGKFGLVAFIDDGRVWMPGEQSDKWHVGYGGGVLLAPFNRFTFSATYGISEEMGRFHFRLIRLLRM